MQAYFGWAKPCSCLYYCCSRHLWFYDSGRLGGVEIVTLTVGARAKEGKGGGGGGGKKKFFFSLLSPRPLPSPFDSHYFLLSSGSFNMALSRANCALIENACTAGYNAPGISEINKVNVSPFNFLYMFQKWSIYADLACDPRTYFLSSLLHI